MVLFGISFNIFGQSYCTNLYGKVCIIGEPKRDTLGENLFGISILVKTASKADIRYELFSTSIIICSHNHASFAKIHSDNYLRILGNHSILSN